MLPIESFRTSPAQRAALAAVLYPVAVHYQLSPEARRVAWLVGLRDIVKATKCYHAVVTSLGLKSTQPLSLDVFRRIDR